MLPFFCFQKYCVSVCLWHVHVCTSVYGVFMCTQVLFTCVEVKGQHQDVFLNHYPPYF